MDKSITSTNGLPAGISIANGPVDEMEIDDPKTAIGKRKSRQSLTNGKSYKEESSEDDEDDAPLVWDNVRR
jgi:DNA topoisomerase-1